MGRTADINSLSVRFGTPGLGGIRDCSPEVKRAQIGGRLSIPELLAVGRVLRTIRAVRDWRRQGEEETSADYLFDALTPNRALEEELDRCILSEDELQDDASPDLASIRRKIRKAQLSIREKLDGIIRMVDEDRYCIDISTQVMATEALLKRANREILSAHLEHCVKDAANASEREQKIDEFVDTLGRILK